MSNKYDYAVFIGRLQPPHKEHIRQIRRGLELANIVIVVLGSERSARSPKNPWTFCERSSMVQACLTKSERSRVIFTPVRDYYYNDVAWFTDLYNSVDLAIEDDDLSFREDSQNSAKVCLLGTKKDSSTWYLDVVANRWKPEFDAVSYKDMVNATDIRNAFFLEQEFPDFTPAPVAKWLRQWKQRGSIFKDMQAEFNYINDYKNQWASAPYPPVFVTTDAVVIQNAHVLVIRRKFNPGKGNLALPGGFLKTDLNIRESMFTELREETRIKVKGGLDVLENSVCDYYVFDHPGRSLRGRTISHAFLLKLPDGGELPKVRGDDDASGAFWLPISDVFRYEEDFFEDHAHIIEYFTRRM